jgi:cation diffusion facilitator family transporter
MNIPEKDRIRKIIQASWVGVIANAILAALKITAGLLAGSLALVGDGIDSASDIVTSVITLFTARLISRPPNLKYPYGYQKADAIASKALSFIIFFAGAQLAISTIEKILDDTTPTIPDVITIWVVIISIISKFLLAGYLLKTGKKVESAMLLANGKNMRNDVLISLSVLLGLGFTIFLRLPIIDQIFALVISIYIMKTGFDIFMETNLELMDGIEDQGVYDDIIKAIESVEGARNPHRLRLRKISNLYLVAVDIEVDPDLKILEGHRIARQVEKSLKKALVNVYDIIVHVEPIGNVEDEVEGITTRDIEERDKPKKLK